MVPLYLSFCTRLVQLGLGVVAVTKKGGRLYHAGTTIDRFHSSDNTLSENAAYQLVSGRICQRRRYTFYKEFECSAVSLQYMPILNAHCHGSLWPGLATECCTQMIKK